MNTFSPAAVTAAFLAYAADKNSCLYEDVTKIQHDRWDGSDVVTVVGRTASIKTTAAQAFWAGYKGKRNKFPHGSKEATIFEAGVEWRKQNSAQAKSEFYRELVVNGQSYKYKVGRRFVKIVGVGVFKKCDVGATYGGDPSNVEAYAVNPATVAKLIKGEEINTDHPEFCSRHGHFSTEGSFILEQQEGALENKSFLERQAMLMAAGPRTPLCPQCVAEEMDEEI
jgi:hypothetical protein